MNRQGCRIVGHVSATMNWFVGFGGKGGAQAEIPCLRDAERSKPPFEPERWPLKKEVRLVGARVKTDLLNPISSGQRAP